MPTLRFFGREFETSIKTDEMTGEEFRSFMDEVIRCGLREMENRQSAQSQRYVNMDGFEYVIPESIKNHEKTWDENGKTDVEKWYRNTMESLSEFYAMLIEAGIPEEDARYVLPNAYTTNINKKVNE